MGALVADAASSGTHALYSPGKLDELVEGNTGHPEFMYPMSSPLFSAPPGAQSPYGDELVMMLETLVGHHSLSGIVLQVRCWYPSTKSPPNAHTLSSPTLWPYMCTIDCALH